MFGSIFILIYMYKNDFVKKKWSEETRFLRNQMRHQEARVSLGAAKNPELQTEHRL